MQVDRRGMRAVADDGDHLPVAERGAALDQRIEERGAYAAALVLGDDRSDALAFGAVAEALVSGRLRAGLALAVHGSSETPREVVERADLILAGPRDAARALSALARAVEGEDL